MEPSKTNITNRDPYLDGLKFLLIFLVVLGHLPFSSLGLHQVIYSFHMPMFVFLSGYFSKPQEPHKLFSSSLRLFRIYLIFDILHIIIQYFLGGNPLTINYLIYPQFALWYLLCLIYWRIAISFKPLSKIKRWHLLIIAIISIAAGFIPVNSEFSFQRAFAFFPFFAIGYYFKQNQLMDILRSKNIWITIVSVIIIVLCLYYTRKIPRYMPKEAYTSINDMFLRMLQGIIALAFMLSIIQVAPKKLVSVFAPLGKDTVYYYAYHTIIVTLLCFYIKKYNLSLDFFEGFLCAVIIIGIITFLTKIKLFGMPFK